MISHAERVVLGTGETFCTVLGVPDDGAPTTSGAPTANAPRTSHPDVADDRGGPRDFKRLITPRDVLLVEAERERDDELGHDSYVSRHVSTDV